MAKKEFTVSELYILKKEFEELLKLEIPFVVRYKLNNTITKVVEKVNSAEKVKEELIKKFGEISEENSDIIEVRETIKDENGLEMANPKFEEFMKEFVPVLEQKEVIEIKELKLADFQNLNTDKPFRFVFDLIDS